VDELVIEELLRDWTDSGLISPQQADGIRSFENARPTVHPGAMTASSEAVPTTSQATPEAQARIPIIGEALGYVGGALAFAALTAIVTQYWSDLGTAGQLLLAAVVSAACLTGGWLLSSLEPAQARRLGGFLLFTGTAAFGFFAGLAADATPLLDSGDLPWVVGAGGAFALGLGLWRSRTTSLQLVAVALALASFIAAVITEWTSHDQTVFIGASYLVVGIVWAILGEMQFIKPRTTAWAMGSLAVLSAPQIMSLEMWEHTGGYLLLGCFVSAALLGVALWLGRGGPLGFGAAGIVIYVPQLLYELFENTLGVPIALLVAGVLLVSMSAVVIVARPRLGRKSAQS